VNTTGPAEQANNNRLKKIVADPALDRGMLQGTASDESWFTSRLEPVAPAGSPRPLRELFRRMCMDEACHSVERLRP